MRCDEIAPLIEGWCDGEPDEKRRDLIASHIATCPDCKSRVDIERRMSELLRQHGREPAPPMLATLLSIRLDEEERTRPAARGSSSRRSAIFRQAAIFIVGCVLSAVASWYATRLMTDRSQLVSEIAAAHIRAMQMDSAVQVASSERHTVKPWFTGRLDFAPEVKDLSAHDFSLIGGRLDYVDARRVAAIVYKRRQHVINVFMWPVSEAIGTPTALASGALALRGFNVVHWQKNGFVFWAVSDLNGKELSELPTLL